MPLLSTTGTAGDSPDQPARHRTGLITILFTDLVGSTALKQQAGDRAAASLIQQHHALVRELLRGFQGGEEIETAGDSFLIVFTKPSDAVHFGLLLHARLRALNQGAASRLEDRIGIHVGEVVIREQDGSVNPKGLTGIQVDTCARVMGLAQGGQILMTRPVFDNARQMLKGADLEGVGNLSWLNYGPYLLKGVDGAVEVCEVREAGAGATTPPTSSEKAQRVAGEGELVLGWRPALDQKVPGTQWVLEAKLGEGGFGEVWAARHEKLKEKRVFKFCFRADRVRSLKREVTLFRLLKERVGEHPNIVKLYDVFFDEPPYYLVEEYVAGRDLKSWSEERAGLGSVPMETRLDLVAQAADGLQAAHEAGIIHRDIKPGNILVSGQQEEGHSPLVAKISDFGIGQVLSEEYLIGLTRGGFTQTIMSSSSSSHTGTHIYMAPELLAGKPASTRSDIYSLGVVLYQMLVGDLSGPVTIDWAKHVSDSLLREDLGRCLAGDPTERFGSAVELAKNLRALPERRAALERQQAEKAALERAAYRRGIMRTAVVATAVVALVAGLALVALQQSRKAKATAVRAQRGETEAQTAEREEGRLREQAQAEAYASDMLLAQQAIAANNFGFARQLLNRHRPHSKSDKDLRGWEWRYLWQQCPSDALATLWQCPNRISGLAASHDGKWLAVGQNSDATAVSLLKFANRTTVLQVTNIPARRGTDVSVAFSPTAPLLAFNSTRYEGARVQPTLHLWNVETGQQVFELPVPAFCCGLAFSPDGSTLLEVLMNLYGDTNGGAMLLKIPEGTPVWKCETPVSRPCPDSAVDAGFRSAAIVGDKLQMIDLATGKVRWSVTNEYFLCSAFTKDGKILMTAQGTPSVFRSWDVSSGKPVGRPVPLHSGVYDFSLLPNGRTLVSDNGGSIHLWDVSDPTNPQALGRPLHGQGSQIDRLAFNSGGKTLLSGNFDGSIYAWDPKPRNPEKSPVVLTGVFDWQFAPDNRSLLTIDPQGHVTRREGPEFQVKNPLLDIGADLAVVRDQAEFSDDGQLLAVSQAGEVRVWDLRNPSPSPRFAMPGWLGARVFAPHSKLLVAYRTISGPLEEWDLNTFQKIGSWPTTIQWKYQSPMALSSRGRFLVNAGRGESECSVIETATGQVGAWKNPESGTITDLSFSPDGSLFAVANMRGYAQVWDSRSRRLIMTLGHRQDHTFALNFSPDNSRLVTASDGPDALTLWDLSGLELLRLQAVQTGGEQFMPVKFSSDGTWLACHDDHNDLYIWRAPSWAEIEAAEKTAPDSQSSNMQKGN